MAYSVTQNSSNKKRFFVENDTTGRLVGNYATVEEAQAVAKRMGSKDQKDIRQIGLDKATVSIHKED